MLACHANGKEELRLNYGVIFKTHGQIQTTNNYWLHSFEMALPMLKYRPIPTSPCVEINVSKSVCQLLQAARLQADLVRTTALESLNDTLSKVRHILPEIQMPSSNSRSKRALLPFIGQLSHSLFGTATEHDVRILAAHIQRLAGQTKTLSRSFQQVGQARASYMTAVDKRFSNAMKGIESNHDAIINIGKQIWYTDHQLVLQTRITGHLVSLAQTANSILVRAEELLQGIILLTQGKLPPSLVSPEMINHLITHIQRKLTVLHPNFKVIYKQPEFYYRTHLFLYTRRGDKIFITIKFPISKMDSYFDLYQISSEPVPVNSSSDHATQLLDLPRYFAISKTKQFYKSMSHNEMLHCQGHVQRVCSSQLHKIPITKSSCTSAIFLQQKEIVKQKCNFRFQVNGLKTSLSQIKPGQILLSNISEFTLVCTGTSKKHKGCHFCIINIPCGCEIYSNEIQLPSFFHNCVNYTGQITKIYPVNLAILQHFFGPKAHEKINPDSMFTKEIQISIPHFQIYNHKFQNILAIERRQHLSLERMVQSAKLKQTIYQSLAEPFMDGTLSLDSDNSIVIYVLSGLACLIAGISPTATTLALKKFKILALTVTTLQQAAKSEALSEFDGVFHYGSSTKAPIPECTFNDKILNLPLYQTIPYMIILIGIVGFLIRVIYKRCNHSTLHLEISSGHDCVILKVKNLTMCPSLWHFTASKTLSNVELEGLVNQTVNIEWGDLMAVNLQTGLSTILPDRIHLTPWQSFKLHKILKQPFQAHLLISHEHLTMKPSICSKSDTCSHPKHDQHCLYPSLPV